MPRSWVERIELFGTGLAIVALTAFLMVALVHLGRLAEDEDELLAAATIGELGKAQFALQDLALAQQAGDAHRFLQQWAQTRDRLAALGPERLAAFPEARAQAEQVAALAEETGQVVRGLARGDRQLGEIAPAVTPRAARLTFLLGRMADAVGRAATAAVDARRRDFGTAILGIIVCVAGSLLAGTFLVLRLTQGMARIRRAEADLRQHRDALEQTVAERTRELTVAETQLRHAINTAPDGFAAFDPGGRLIVANDMARQLLPAARDLLAPGTPMAEVLRATGAFLAPLDLGEGAFAHTAELEAPDGSWVMVSLRRAPDGSAVMRLADITPYKRATHTLESALAREQNLRRLYKDFVAMVSHQFRTPIALIDSAAQKILRHGRGGAWEDIADRAGQIRVTAAGLAQLVDGTLDSARLESGAMPFDPVETDLRGLLVDLCARLQEVYPERRLEADLARLPQRVRCDPLLLEHVVGNLISNAAKYSDAGSPVVVTGRADAHSVAISVRDEGVGIPREELERVFDYAYRARNAAGTAGSGIGLHVARRIARLHGGDLLVDSEMGRGTVVTLKLPWQGALPAARP